MEKKNKTGFNIWDYLYYRTTLLYRRVEKNAGFGANKDTGAFLVATCIYFNIESFCFLALPLLLGDILIEVSKTDIFIYANGGLFIIILLASLYILEKKRHKMIFKRYEKESPKQREMRGWIVMVYIFLSVATLGASIFIGREYILGVLGTVREIL